MWIGLTKPFDDCSDVSCRRKHWNWDDDSAYDSDLIQWSMSEPNTGELCARIILLDSIRLYGSDCANNNIMGSCLCEKSIETGANTCQIGSKSSSEGCYMMTSVQIDQAMCVETCQEDGGNIVSLSDERETIIVTNL